MKRNIKTKRFLALLMSLMLLTALLPMVAFTESNMTEYAEDDWDDPADDGGLLWCDAYYEEQEYYSTEDEPLDDWEEDTPTPSMEDDALFVEYWGESVPPDKRIAHWLEKADMCARDWKPSECLFLDQESQR